MAREQSVAHEACLHLRQHTGARTDHDGFIESHILHGRDSNPCAMECARIVEPACPVRALAVHGVNEALARGAEKTFSLPARESRTRASAPRSGAHRPTPLHAAPWWNASRRWTRNPCPIAGDTEGCAP